MRPSDEVHRVQHVPRKQQQSRMEKPGEQPRSKSQGRKLRKCKFCGRDHEFKKELCPAFRKFCKRCNKPNHFAKMCHSKTDSVQYNECLETDNELVLVLRGEREA